MKKRKFTSDFKTKVVLETLSERYTIQELARKHELHATQISTWKAQFLKKASSVFENPGKDPKTEAEQKEGRYLNIIGNSGLEGK